MKRHIILNIALCTFFMAGLQACSSTVPEAPAEVAQAPELCEYRWVVFTSPDGTTTARFKAEQAQTPEAKEQGLMFREYMPPDHGMIFYWDTPQPIYMWMKNTLIPLDMVYAVGGKVTGVVEASETESLRVLTVPGNADTVLELNLGVAAAKGIKAGWDMEPAGCVPLPEKG